MLLGLLVVGGYYAIGVAKFMANPFAGFAGETEFENLSGAKAKKRMREWPDSVSENDVTSLSRRHIHSRDSFATWYRIKIGAQGATNWQDSIHANKSKSPRYEGDSYDGYEGVRHRIQGPPPEYWDPEQAPRWWNPPPINFRATEMMIWYQHGSGIGQALYSGFDETKQELWIYDNAAQHSSPWDNRSRPKGDAFGDLDQETLDNNGLNRSRDW